MLHGEGKELLHPIGVRLFAYRSGGGGVVPAVHGQQVAYGHGCQIFADGCRKLVGEEGDDLVRQLQPAFGGGKSHGGGGECLADGVQDVRLILFPFAHPFFGNDIAVLHNHDTVQVLSGFLYGIQISVHGLVQLRSSGGAGQALGQLVDGNQLYAFVLNGFPDAGACQQVGHSLAVQRHVLISDVEDGFHFIVVQCRVV